MSLPMAANRPTPMAARPCWFWPGQARISGVGLRATSTLPTRPSAVKAQFSLMSQPARSQALNRSQAKSASDAGVHTLPLFVRLECLGVVTCPLPPPLDDAEWVRARRADGATISDLAQAAGSGTRAPRLALARHGLPVHAGGHRPVDVLADPVLLRAAIASAPTFAALVARTGRRHEVVRAACAEHGIPAPPPRKQDKSPELDDPSWLRARYHDEQMTFREIAVLLGGVSESRVGLALRRHGIAARPCKRRPPPPGPTGVSVPSRGRRIHPMLADRDWLASRLDGGASWLDVAEELDVPVARVGDAVARHRLRDA